MNDVMEQGSRFLRELGDAANRNPVSAALIGMGVLGLFAGRKPAQRARALFGRASGAASDLAGETFDSASSAVSSGASAASRAMNASTETVQRRTTGVLDAASRAGRERMGSLSEYGASIPQRGGGRLQDLGGSLQDFGDSLTDLFQRQPLAVAAVGVAIGAGIAAALPLTEMETTRLGEAGEAIKERAGRAMDAAADEARNQGLTMEGARSAAHETTAKLGRVIGAVKEGRTERPEAGQ